MKESPALQKARELMQPGRLTRDGMLGDDRRSLGEIMDADQNALNSIGLSHANIAARLRALTEAGLERLGDAVVVEGTLEIRVEEARGTLPCPFGHPGRFPKSVTHCKHLESGQSLRWTPLSVHMIEAHGFYQGVGSPFRLDPVQTAQLLCIGRRG